MEWLSTLTDTIFRRNPESYKEVFYIGGSDTLPSPLSKEEEHSLLTRLEEGDMSVKSTLIEHNLRLVVFLSKKFESTGYEN